MKHENAKKKLSKVLPCAQKPTGPWIFWGVWQTYPNSSTNTSSSHRQNSDHADVDSATKDYFFEKKKKKKNPSELLDFALSLSCIMVLHFYALPNFLVCSLKPCCISCLKRITDIKLRNFNPGRKRLVDSWYSVDKHGL